MSGNGTVKTKEVATKPKDLEVEFDFSDWSKMSDLWEYQDLANGNDREAFFEYIMPRVKSWNLPDDPQDIQTYSDMTFKFWDAFKERMTKAVQDILKS